MKKEKLDIIIPVFGNANLLKLCVYALFKNTDNSLINKVYIINSNCNDVTVNCINNLMNKYKKISILSSDDSLIENYKSILKSKDSKFLVLLNQKCIISSKMFENLIFDIKKNADAQGVVPLTNEFIEMPENFTYMQFNSLLNDKFKGDTVPFDYIDCNCILLKKELVKVNNDGDLFNSFSFDTNKILLSLGCFAFVTETENKIIDYVSDKIYSKITIEDKKLSFDFVTYLIAIVQDSGGVHVAIDMINYLVINGVNCNILYNDFLSYYEPMLFKPIYINNVDSCNIKSIMSTIYFSTFYAKKIADMKDIPLIYFAQGYEPFFNSGIEYAIAELSYKIADEVLTISNFLYENYKNNFDVESTLIKNGINFDMLYKNIEKDKIKNISLILRGNDLKGDFLLLDVVKKMTKKFNNININVICNNKNVKLPFNDNETIVINRIDGPLHREDVTSILHNTDIYIDGSLTEGFGLMALEAMASGAVVISSDAGGNLEYLKNEYNGLVVDKVNYSDEYIDRIKLLLDDKLLYNKLRKNSLDTVKNYDFDDVIEKYILFFKSRKKKRAINLTTEEQELFDFVLETKFKVYKSSKCKQYLRKFGNKVPKRIRAFIKKIINKVYGFVNYE